MEAMSATNLTQSEVRLTGWSISPGLGMGHAWVIGDVLKWSGPPTQIGPNDVDGEFVRLTTAFEETLADLDQSARRIEFEFDTALAGIFRTHGEILRGLFTSGEFEQELRTSRTTAEAIVPRVLQQWYRKFEALENQTLRQRADDVLDLGRNIIRASEANRKRASKPSPRIAYWLSSDCCRRMSCRCLSRMCWR